MEASSRRRLSSAAAGAVVFLLALVLVAGGVVAATSTGKQQERYMFVEMDVGDAGKTRLAMREDGTAIAGFANWKGQWFATPGSENLVPAAYRRHRSSSNGGGPGGGEGQGLGNLLAMLVTSNNNRTP